MKHLKKFNEGYRDVPEDNTKHCRTVEKFMKYFHSKMMNKQAWWIDGFHLPKIDNIFCDSMSYDKDTELYRFSPFLSKDKWIRDINKENVPPSIRSIMDKVGCDYIDFCTMDHNYGYLMSYNKEGMRYSKSLDPKHIDEDEFAQLILETLVDQKFKLKNDYNL